MEFLENGFSWDHEILHAYRDNRLDKPAGNDVTIAAWRFEKRQKMPCQKRLQISRVKHIGNVLEQCGVAFRLAPPDGGLLVLISRKLLKLATSKFTTT